jgi:xylan 1,4-beta-xylosidase
LALRTDWRAQLARVRRELGVRRVRFHDLFGSAVGLVQPWQSGIRLATHNTHQIWDALLAMDVRPIVELSFMPEALASGHRTVFRYHANVTPPRRLDDWADVVERVLRDWRERYGADELARWLFEVWNEPNQPEFWAGSQDEYFAFYAATARAVKSVDEALPVGGPATSKNAWIEAFLVAAQRHRAPVDFVSTHHYPTDAVGQVSQDTVAQLAAARPGILREEAQEARRHAGALPLYYTEWCTSSNPRDSLHDEPYAAAFAALAAIEAAPWVDGYSYWTFSDVFEEIGFPAAAFHGGFGLLTIDGVPKPVYRAFELLHRLAERQLVVDGQHETAVAHAFGDAKRAQVLLVNHAFPRHPIAAVDVEVELIGVPASAAVSVERVDERHANAHAVWRDTLGSPAALTPAQVEQLVDASRLVREPLTCQRLERRAPFVPAGASTLLRLQLPPQGVALVTLEEEP